MLIRRMPKLFNIQTEFPKDRKFCENIVQTCGLISDFQKQKLGSQYFKNEVRHRQPALHLNTGLARHPVMGKFALLKNLVRVFEEVAMPRTREQFGKPGCSAGKQRCRESKQFCYPVILLTPPPSPPLQANVINGQPLRVLRWFQIVCMNV